MTDALDEAFSVVKIAIILFVIMVIPSCLMGCLSQYNHEWRSLDRVMSEDKIMTLNLGSVSQGSFSLGCGIIDGETYYYYYKIESGGGYTLQRAPTERSVIFMDSAPENAHVTVINSDPDPIRCRDDWTDEYCKANSWVFTKNYNFHVPPGTIVQNYDAGYK